MKCYNPRTYEKLGFDAILHRLGQLLHSEEAQERLEKLQPYRNHGALQTELQRVFEFKSLLDAGESVPALRFFSITSILDDLSVGGNWLSVDQLFQLLGWLLVIRDLRKFLQKRQEEYPNLHELVCGQEFADDSIKAIQAIVDERGNLRDDASPKLAQLRKERGKTAGELRSTLYRVLRRANDQNWSLDKEITIRNNRLVIPVKADSKGHVPGFVQDVSQSGGTVFLEPAEALPLNNRLREIDYEEHNEVTRILQEITAQLRINHESWRGYREVMVKVELIRAKARLATELNATLPQVDPDGDRLEIREGYFPPLVLKARKVPMEVVPMNLSFNPQRRIFVISGPNAGGKSISLKTVGLLQLMLQTGILLPVREDSVFCLFDSLFVDIGDEQSVDNDLSTYTSHLYQWRQMGDNMRKASLFLIDEFGSGTDPKQGGAIAEAFLERFVRVGAYGVITTHYGNLKDFAEVTSGVVNAAMEFDTDELKPTYRLMEGLPGRSYAFEMAQRVGVHSSVLKKARKKAGTEEMDVEKLLRQLEEKNTKLNRSVEENEAQKRRLDRLVEKNENLKAKLEKNRKQLMREAQVEAQRLLKDANRRIENTIREIKENQADKAKTQKLRQELAESVPEVEPLPEEPQSQPEPAGVTVLRGEPVAVGDWVKPKQSDSYGRLVEVRGKKGTMEVGELRVTVPLQQLVKVIPPATKTLTSRGIHLVSQPSMATVRMELDVLGQRVETALPEVDKWLDDARMAGLKRLRVLHGKGSGTLRDAIRKHLSQQKDVTDLNDAPIEEGGAGWTVIRLG